MSARSPGPDETEIGHLRQLAAQPGINAQAVSETLSAASHPQWVRSATSGFNISEGDTEVLIEWRRGPDAGQEYTADVKRTEIEQLAACGRALLAAGFDTYYAAATHGNRMLIIPRTPGPRHGLVRVPADFTAYHITRSADDSWIATPRPPLSDDPGFQQAIQALGETLQEAALSEIERQRAGILANLREGLARARNLEGPAGEFSRTLLEVISVVLGWQPAPAASRGPAEPQISVSDATDQIIAAISRGLAGTGDRGWHG